MLNFLLLAILWVAYVCYQAESNGAPLMRVERAECELQSEVTERSLGIVTSGGLGALACVSSGAVPWRQFAPVDRLMSSVWKADSLRS